MEKINGIIFLLLVALLSACIEDPEFSREMQNSGKPVFKGGATYISKTASSIKFSAEILKENGSKITERGFVWAVSSNPTVENGNVVRDTDKGTGMYDCELKGLKGNTRHYIRPYAINEKGIEYGEPELEIETNHGLGTVQTNPPPRVVHAASLKTGGQIMDAGEGEIIRRGVYYSRSKIFLNKDSVISADNTGEFVCQLINLTPSTTYYYKAFATNTFGTFEGLADSVTTANGLVETALVAVKYRDYNEVMLETIISNEKDTTVQIIERGFCWSTNANPTTANDTVQAGSGNGYFQALVKRLTARKDYYARAYVKTVIATSTPIYGTVYSEPLLFRSKDDLPTVITEECTNLQDGKVDVACTVPDNGKSNVDSVGICYSTTNKKPTLADNREMLRPELGHRYSGKLTKLKGGTTYYVRAYASNSEGTQYGETKEFLTPSIFTTGLAAFPGGDLLQKSNAYFSRGDILYILGGDRGASYSNELWGYSISDNTWREYKRFTLDTAKWQSGIAYGLGAFVFGGLKEKGVETNSFSFYESGSVNLWRSHPAAPDSVHSAIMFAQGNNIYVVGGKKEDAVKNTVWSYDAGSRVWVQRPDFPVSQYEGIAVIVNDVAYVGMGRNSAGRGSGSLWSSRDGANTWQGGIYCPFYIGGILGGVACGKSIYVIDEDFNIIEYNTEQSGGGWIRPKCRVPEAYRKFNCIFENNGRIFIGLGGSGTAKSFVVYDPVWDN